MSATISVALCTYNGAGYLPELLDSIAAQERHPDEIVVCDDRSRDNTIELIDAFAARVPFPVHVHRNERNLGTAANFEKAIGLCTGSLIAPCDQDDIWLPKKLLRSEEAFASDPQLGFVFCDAELIDGAGRRLDRRLWESVGFSPARRARAESGELLKLLVLYTFVTGTAMTMRADLRSFVLPIPTGWVHDAWIALMSCFVRRYALIDEPLLLYRLHSAQQIGVPAVAMPDDTALVKWRARLSEAPAKMSLARADVHRQRRRTQAMMYDAVATRFEQGAERYVAAHGGEIQPPVSDALAEARERARHLHVRGEMPDHRADRLPRIYRELRTGRYGRYSAGILSALQDLVS